MKPSFLGTVFALSTSVMSGCLDDADDPGNAEATSTESDAIFKTNAFGWPRDANGVTTTIPICWDERDYYKGPPESMRGAVKDFVRQAVEETWQRESGIVFIGWGECHSGGGGTFGIDLHMETSGLGITYFLHPWWEPYHADVHLPAGEGTTDHLRYTAIHEVGHALGLVHEQARGDTRGRCTHTDTFDWLAPIYGGPVTTPYDDRSIMNYCAGWATQLSPLDIMGIQRLYGRKPGVNLVNSRGSCVGASFSSVVLASCTAGAISSGFNPSDDVVRLPFFVRVPFVGVRTVVGEAAAPTLTGYGTGYGPLSMTTGAINPSRDHYHFTNVTIRGLAGKKLNVAYGLTSPGAAVATWEDGSVGWAANVSPNELWTFQPGGSIRGIGGQCLDVKWGDPASGTPVWMWPCNGTAAQRWRLSAGDEIVSAVGVRKCLEANRDETDIITPFAQAQDVRIADCNGSLRQKWSVRGPITTLDGAGCIDAPRTASAVVAQRPCDGTAGQQIDVHW